MFRKELVLLSEKMPLKIDAGLVTRPTVHVFQVRKNTEAKQRGLSCQVYKRRPCGCKLAELDLFQRFVHR